MNYLLPFIIFGACIILMAVGLIFSNKCLKKGCSMNPDDCACKKREQEESEKANGAD